LESDIARSKKHPKPVDDRYVGIEVKGVFYSDKAKAGKAILDVCTGMTNPGAVPLGTYRGFELEVSFDRILQTFEVKLKGETTFSAFLGADALGNLTRIDNAVERLPDQLDSKKLELDNTKKQFETAKIEVEKPFSQEEELQQKTSRLQELNILLNLDKNENEFIDSEPDDKEMIPFEKEKDYER